MKNYTLQIGKFAPYTVATENEISSDGLKTATVVETSDIEEKKIVHDKLVNDPFESLEND